MSVVQHLLLLWSLVPLTFSTYSSFADTGYCYYSAVAER